MIINVCVWRIILQNSFLVIPVTDTGNQLELYQKKTYPKWKIIDPTFL